MPPASTAAPISGYWSTGPSCNSGDMTPATPFLCVDHDRLLANIGRTAAWATERGLALRPHAKTHKSPAVADLQLAAGAIGLTVATVGEAEVFAGVE